MAKLDMSEFDLHYTCYCLIGHGYYQRWVQVRPTFTRPRGFQKGDRNLLQEIMGLAEAL
jgi:hypothetical protein